MINVKDYEGLYKINEFGEVFSVKRNKFLKPDTSGDGYARYTLSKNGKTKKFFSHRLMMCSYNVKQTGEVINHKDGNKLNNTLENLEWCSVSYNNSHAYKIGLKSQNGELNHRSKFKKNEIIEIRRLKERGYTNKNLAKMYNTTACYINSIVAKRRWKHIE